MSTAVFVPADGVRPVPTKSGRALYYFGEYHSSARGPQGFMNESGAGSQIRPHFHYENQFQVFLAGNGSTFQRQEIPKLMVHYSEAGTAYGPISSGDEGLDFFTLRQNGNEFTGYMPEDKGLLDPTRRRRHLTVDLASWLEEELPASGAFDVRDTLPAQDDSLRVVAITVGPNSTITSPSPAEGEGQYLVVVEGELQHEGNDLGPRTVGWCDPADEAPFLIAGDHGARYLVLQFSTPSTMDQSLN